MKLYEIIPSKLYQRGKIRENQYGDLEIFDLVIGLAGGPVPKAIYRPMADGEKIPIAILSELVDMAEGVILQGGMVLVYCNGGRNCSSLLNALIVRKLFGISGLKAIGHIRSIRPRVLSNSRFLDYLESLP